jgi:hypothetical protein
VSAPYLALIEGVLGVSLNTQSSMDNEVISLSFNLPETSK